MKTNFAEIKKTWDARIKAGDKLSVQNELLKLDPRSLPREVAIDFADMARRVGLPLVALKILTPIIRPKNSKAKEPSTDELAMWAANLVKLGSQNEALDILGKMDQGLPGVQLYTGYAHVSRWDYAAAAPFFRRYIKNPELDEYQRAVGQLNLSASYVYLDESEKARVLLTEVLEMARDRGWHLLQSNALELLAGASVAEADVAMAQQLWADAAILVEHGSVDQLQIRKFQSIIELRQKGPIPEAVQALEHVRTEAYQIGHWETVRDCDLYLALATKDSWRISKVYFGTPYPSYRRRIETLAANWFLPPGVFCWEIGNGAGNSNKVFDFTTGRENYVPGRRGAELELGGLVHRLFRSLASDFYRPHFIGSIFASIYGREYFNPANSPARIARLLNRLRVWFSDHQIPLQITVEHFTYRLTCSEQYAVVVSDDLPVANVPLTPGIRERVRTDALDRLREIWPYRAFSSSQAATALQISTRSAQEYLGWGLASRRLYAEGTGRARRYYFKK